MPATLSGRDSARNGSTCRGTDDLFIGRCNRRRNSPNERASNNELDKNGGGGGGAEGGGGEGGDGGVEGRGEPVDRTVSSAAVKIRMVSS